MFRLTAPLKNKAATHLLKIERRTPIVHSCLSANTTFEMQFSVVSFQNFLKGDPFDTSVEKIISQVFF